MRVVCKSEGGSLSASLSMLSMGLEDRGIDLVRGNEPRQAPGQ